MGSQKITQTDYYQEWPSELQKAAASALNTSSCEPIVFDVSDKANQKKLLKFVASTPITSIHDNYDEQLAELVISRNPQVYRANIQVKRASVKEYVDKHYDGVDSWKKGSWVYFPWNGKLIHILNKELFGEMRTIRNKDLITQDEQKQLSDIRVGCLGMSVGSNAATSIAIEGTSNKLKIADGAVISGSNLNRIRAAVHDIGEVKSKVIARQLYEMNPYQELIIYPSITEKNLKSFFEDPWSLDVVVDEVDDLETKIRLRIEARRRGIPVLMVTDLGDSVMLDVERFDTDENLPLFHGLAGDIEKVLERKDMTQREWLKFATSIINTKNVPLRMQQSLLKIGTKLVTQPQLGVTAIRAGGVLAYAVRMICLGQPLKTGRYSINLDDLLLAGATSRKNRKEHKKHTKLVQDTLDSM
ncbi:TPA: hypothetical protein EYO12_02800 [Candidatus Saccharibacteria bacterium]|nr:hypothetical protein [Candidatus Saccharibacteria bacterium]HIO88032.1 hypothetical protein [Candidatus Saccharibacteria bacterium]